MVIETQLENTPQFQLEHDYHRLASMSNQGYGQSSKSHSIFVFWPYLIKLA